MSHSANRLPAEPGSYLLWLYLPKRAEAGIGKLGHFPLRRGWYLYCGSAFGPGGLRARLQHHLRPLQRYHWHIDYLRQIAEIRRIWLMRGHNFEHLWSEALLTIEGAEMPLPGFGASDCRCPSHLLQLRRQPALRPLKSHLETACGQKIIAISTFA